MAIPIINSGVEYESWTADEMKLVERVDDMLRSRGMQMIIICEDCLYKGKDPKVIGDNKRSSSAFHLTCAHKRRTYQPATA